VGDSPNRYKASKQADVLMLFYLLSAEELRGLLDRLGYRLEPAAIRRTVDYYLERTSHGSTLSGVVNAWVLARCDRPRSWRFFAEALASDLHDVQGGTTAEGIHLGAMAGTVDLAQRCYTGLEAREDVLWLNPSLPEELDGLDFDVRYRGNWGINLQLIPQLLRVRLADSDAAPIKAVSTARSSSSQRTRTPYAHRRWPRGRSGGDPAGPAGPGRWSARPGAAARDGAAAPGPGRASACCPGDRSWTWWAGSRSRRWHSWSARRRSRRPRRLAM
jgi:trehalose/maltose hydrolase-like predicted phosphorylase